MKIMAAGQSKARCLGIMMACTQREPMTITKKGKPLELAPADIPRDDIFGCMKGIVEIVGDVEAAVVPPEDWQALQPSSENDLVNLR